MKISVNWIKEYAKVDLPIDELVTKIGAQIGEVEEVVDLGKKYNGAVVVKVVTCEKHPDADKLSVCMVDDNKAVKDVERDKNGYIQIVCGAPNVKADMLAVWLPPSTVVPSTLGKDPFKLEARKLRGVVSNGMLASAAELDLGDDHSGILELEEGKAGQNFADVFGLDDYVIDIENKMFTHRPDCFGILGVAREISGIQANKFDSPDWYLYNPSFEKGSGLELEVDNQIPERVARFMAVAVSGVEVKRSPVNFQTYLLKVGIKPINNVVDVTNYIMHLTGQPMHAYDYDKVKALSNGAPKLTIRNGQKDEELKALGGKMLSLNPSDITIAADKKAIGLGGVMGGADTEVDENTKNIILECANFDMYSIRRTSMSQGLFTDAVTRFTKGQSQLQNDRVLFHAMGKIKQYAGGDQATDVIDIFAAKNEFNLPQNVHTEFVNKLLGLKLSTENIVDILHNVEFAAEITRGDVLVVRAPFWRTDIEIDEDVAEEVGRLYGYDHVPLELPVRAINPVGPDQEILTKDSIRSKLAVLGANEVLTYSFVHGNLLEAASQDNENAYKIKNALSPDLQYYRLSLLPSLLEKVHPNIKQGYDEFALFELAKVHGKSETEDGLPKELGRVGLVVASKSDSADYFLAKHYLESLYSAESKFVYKTFKDSGLSGHKMFSQMVAPLDSERSAVVYIEDKIIGVVGEFNQKISKKLKLPKNSAGFELFQSSFSGDLTYSYEQISKYPSTDQDICLRTSFDLSFSDVDSELKKSIKSHAPEDVVCAVKPIDIFAKDTEHKQTTFRLTAFSHDRTLTNEVTNLLLNKVSDDLKKSIKAERV